ncbi:hypothetical protein AcV5_006323 [Taiwanofungus camphoratus]|nr:hypothetical protein AcV5_006323 [Antrodia cinnamomea]
MPFARCRFYNDQGEAIHGECMRIGSGCQFIHPGEPRWASARSRNRPDGAGRGRGGAGPGPGDWGGVVSEWDNLEAGWGNAGAAGSTSKAMPPPSAPTGPRKRKEPESASAWGNAWGNPAQDAGGVHPHIPKTARIEPGRVDAAGWGSPHGGWDKPGKAEVWWGSSAQDTWGQPDGVWEADSVRAEKAKEMDSWGWSASSRSGDGTRAGKEKEKEEEKQREKEKEKECSKEKEEESAKEKAKDPWGWGAVGRDGGAAQESSGPLSGRPTWDDIREATKVPSISIDTNVRPNDHVGPSSPRPPSPTRPDRGCTSGPPRQDSSMFFDVSGKDDGRDNASPVRLGGAHASPLDALNSPHSPTHKAPLASSDLGGTSVRAESPAPSSTDLASGSGASYTWKKYIRTLQRAVAVQQEISAGNDERESIRRLQHSKHFSSVGHKARSVLEGLRIDHEKKMASLQKRLNELIDELIRLSSSTSTTFGTNTDTSESTEDIKMYCEEVKGWIDSVRPIVMDLQSQAYSPLVPSVPDDVPPGPSKRRRESSSDEKPVDSSPASTLRAHITRLEERLDELDYYFEQLRASSKAIVGENIESFDRVKKPLFPSNVIEEGEIPPPALPDPPAQDILASDATRQLDALEQQKHKVHEDLSQLQDQVQGLKARHHELYREHCKLGAEREELSIQQALLEQASVELRKETKANEETLRQLRETLDHLTARQPPPPPVITVEDICAEVHADMKQMLHNEVMDVVGRVRGAVEQHLRAQQEEVCSTVWVKMQPTLRIVQSIYEFMEVQKTSTKGSEQVHHVE